MTYTLIPEGILYEGAVFPLDKPEGFDGWLKTKQDAYVQGILSVYRPAQPAQPQPSKEVFL